jgi:hypothetical protein
MSGRSPDWRIWLGLTLTTSWLLLGGVHISQDIGWNNFTRLPAAELGSFLEGAFAPLAFLWLVIGYFLQQKELQQNTEALKAQADQIQRSAEQAVIQSEKMAASEIHARQEAFLQIYRTVRGQLGTVTGFLYISSQASAADGTVTPEEQSKLFAASGQDPELNLIYHFERLMRRAEAVDPDQLIRDALISSGHGLAYSLARRHQADAPPELAERAQTGTAIFSISERQIP